MNSSVPKVLGSVECQTNFRFGTEQRRQELRLAPNDRARGIDGPHTHVPAQGDIPALRVLLSIGHHISEEPVRRGRLITGGGGEDSLGGGKVTGRD